jgi:hypothetical protein
MLGCTPYPRATGSASSPVSGASGTLIVRPHFGHRPTRPGVAPFAFIRNPQGHDRTGTLMGLLGGMSVGSTGYRPSNREGKFIVRADRPRVNDKCQKR